MRATIKDVAKLAGVSTATVSNVLTGRKNVSESLRRRVNEASAELDYKPNSIARTHLLNGFMHDASQRTTPAGMDGSHSIDRKSVV